MFLNKTFSFGVTAAAALFALSTAASAVTVIATAVIGDADPVEDGVVDISVDDIFTVQIATDAADVGSGADEFSFGFEATEALITVETNSLNPIEGFLVPTVIWSTGINGTGTVLGVLNGTSAGVDSGSLRQRFEIGDIFYLTAAFDDVLAAGADFDIRLEASPVPLPAGVLLMGTALAGFGVARRRKSKA